MKNLAQRATIQPRKPQDIRDLVQAEPFKPLRLHLADGKSLRIAHPDFVLVTRDMVVIANKLSGGVPGDINLVPYEHIVRIEMLPRKASKAA